MNEDNKHINLIDYMLLNHKYEFANNTLVSMRKYYEKNNELTEKQEQAIENIYNSISTKIM